MTLGLHSKKAPRVYNQGYFRVVGDKIILTVMRCVQESGFECENPDRKIKSVNDGKLQRNLSRSRQSIFEYGYCNDWDWFCTFTLDSKKIDRSDLNGFEKKFNGMIQWLKKKGYDIQYLIVPELHEDKTNWHFHGLMRNIPENELRKARGRNGYNWTRYAKKFGHCYLEPIRNQEAVSKYLTKYISKNFDIEKSFGVSELYKNTYLVSRGLKKGVTIKIGPICGEIDRCLQEPDYENEHCKKYELTVDDIPDLLSLYDDKENLSSGVENFRNKLIEARDMILSRAQ